jgi:hypothetical protein
MREANRWVVLAGGGLVAAATVWSIIGAALYPAALGGASGFGQFVLAAVGFLVMLVEAVKKILKGGSLPPVEEVADLLAVAVRSRWEQAASERRLIEPAPLPIRWCHSALPVAGPLTGATRERGEPARFDPLPGLTSVTDAQLQRGGRSALHDGYGGLASGRLVLLGEPGSGKSAAAILLLLDALRFRERAGSDDRSRVPVPVLFTLHGWNPVATPVRDWVLTKLTDIPSLQGRNGLRRAARLLDAGLIAVFLDGLDEIHESVRPLALQALSEQARFRMVLLSRSSELVTAAGHAHLVGAVALQLQPVTPADAAKYLLANVVTPAPPGWKALTDALTRDPASIVARTLNNPLALTLCRDAYPPAGPVEELGDSSYFPTPEAIMNHLLDRALAAAYTPRLGQPPPRYTLDTARSTLSYIARQLNQDGTRDLAWWRIPRWTPRTAAALISGLGTWCVVGLAFGVLFQFTERLEAAVGIGLAAGVTTGIVTGLAAGCQFGPTHRIRTLRLAPGKGLPAGLVAGFASGLVFLMLAIAVSYFGGPAISLPSPLTIAFAGGVAVGFGTGLGTARRDGAPQRTRPSWWRTPLAGEALWVGLAVGFIVTFVGWAENGAETAVLGLLIGLGTALATGLARPGIDTDAHGPRDTQRLDRAAGLVIAFTAGLTLVLGTSFTVLLGVDVRDRLIVLEYVFGVGLALGVAVALTVWLAVTKTWPTLVAQAILAVQRRTPWRLMRFLEDARNRHVLRTVGPIYQFRHAALHDYLAKDHAQAPIIVNVDLPEPGEHCESKAQLCQTGGRRRVRRRDRHQDHFGAHGGQPEKD